MASSYKELEDKARWVRRQVLDIVYKTKEGHLGSTLSCTDLFVALYYGGVLNYDAKNSEWEDRDRFLTGKGHACLAPYNIWADLGFFDASKLDEYGTDGSTLGDQLELSTPGVDACSGSMGHALNIAVGMVMAANFDDRDYMAFVLIGDGEMTEGSVWEAILFAGFHKLNKIKLIIDKNNLQIIGAAEDVLDTDPLDEKFKAFHWDVSKIDGHDFNEIIPALQKKTDKPHVIIANTARGKGISFMENSSDWYNKSPSEEEYKNAVKELS